MKPNKNIIQTILSLLLSVPATLVKTTEHNKQVLMLMVLLLTQLPSGATAATANATVIIAFDDGWKDAITNAFPVMNANGQKGVIFAIPEVVDGGYTDYMGVTELSSLYAAGWDISSHSYTHGSKYTEDSPEQLFYLTRANNAELKYELGDSKDWLDNNGFINSSMFFAYPYGTYDTAYCMSQPDNDASICGTNDVAAEIKAAGYYVGARSIDAYSWRHAGTHPKYKKGDADALEMATMAIDNTANSYPAAIMAEINNTIAEKGLLVITFHHIVDATPASAEEYSKANLTIISDFLNSKSSEITVQSFSDYFEVPYPIPANIPGTPEVGVITNGTSWANVAWTEGSGAKTDVYDINVTVGALPVNRTYNRVTNSINVTGIPDNTSVVIEVTAINRTWGNTSKNPLSLIISTKTTPIPDTTAPVISLIAPVNSSTYMEGLTIYANYTCTDVNLKSCIGTVLNGGKIDTTGIGTKTFTVDAEDMAGNKISKMVTYTVSAIPDTTDPTILIITPSATTTYTVGSTVLANFTCNDDAALSSCVGTVANGSQINVTGAGTKTFTVNAADMAGHVKSVSVIYTVVAAPVVTPTPSNNGGGGGSSSGSSGGGGGGSMFNPNAKLFERSDTVIQKDMTTSAKYSKNGLVSQVTLFGLKTYGDVTEVVSLLKVNPTDVELNNVYEYFEITVGTIKAKEQPLYLNSPVIYFSVKKSIAEGKVVKVYRFVDGEWALVPLEELDASSDSRQFVARPTGFQNFAIVLDSPEQPDEIVPQNTPVVSQTPSESTTVPETKHSSNWLIELLSRIYHTVFG